MADTKISALTAATAMAGANEFAINEAGTSKKLTGTQMKEFIGKKLIAGNSGAANAAAAPSETWQILTANATANVLTALVTVMTTTDVPAGTYLVQYHVIYQCSATTTGANFAVNHTGTVTRARFTRLGQTGLATAADGLSRQSVTALAGGVAQAWAGRAINTNLGPSAGVDVVNVDQMDWIHGILVTSTTGSLELKHASELASSTQVMADTMLVLRRLA